MDVDRHQRGSRRHLCSRRLCDGVSGTAAGGACTISAGLVHCAVGTIAAGDSSTVTIVVSGDTPGIIVDRASAAGNEFEFDLTNNAAEASPDVLAHPTRITYTGATTSDYHDAALFSAVLVDLATGLPLGSKAVDFALDAQACTNGTNALGVVSCTIAPNVAPGSYPLSAAYAGSFLFIGSIDTRTFDVTLEQTATVYTGVTGYVTNGSTVTLSATLRENGVTPIGGRTIALTLGSQSCSDVTNASGVASCTVVVAQPTGPGLVTATFTATPTTCLPMTATACSSTRSHPAAARLSSETRARRDPSRSGARSGGSATA